MRKQDTKRWEVERYVFQNQPYRLKLLSGQREHLEEMLLAFCETPRSAAEITAMLGERTDCPEDRLRALMYTLEAGLWRAAGFGGWLDETFGHAQKPNRCFTTAAGKQELARRLAARERALAEEATMQGVGQ